MKPRLKRIALAIACSAPLLYSTQLNAGNVMNEIFGMMTTSADATAYESQKRNGMAFGTFSARFSTYSPKVIKFEAPSLSAGCGGIDFFGGSLSLIKKEELVQMARSIAAGAAVYAFNLAVESICPSCAQAMSWLQQKLDQFNALVKSDCETTVQALKTAEIGLGAAEKLKEKTDLSGWSKNLPDYASTLVDGQASWLTLLSERADTGKVNEATAIGLYGNLVWSSLSETEIEQWDFIPGWEAKDLKELLMSIIGTRIIDAENSSGGKLETTNKNPSLEIEDLLFNKPGFTQTTNKIKLLRCVPISITSPTGSECLEFISGSGSEVQWEGLVDRIDRLIMGSGSDLGIADRIVSKVALSVEQQSFVNKAPIALMTMLFVLRRDHAATASMSRLIAFEIGNSYINRLMQEITKMIRLSTNAVGASPEASGEAIAFLKESLINIKNQRVKIKEIMDGETEGITALYDRYNEIADKTKSLSRLGG